ncbi:MAG: hypothetical protein AAF600_04680 [Bacteroidota bacterium]
MMIKDVKKILDRLAGSGWRELFLTHDLDLSAKDLSKELRKNLKVDRTQPGFEDFCSEGSAGIVPYFPAKSLLFHGLASPQVDSWRDKTGKVIQLKAFPTLEDISTIENYVYAAEVRTIDDIRVQAGGKQLAIVMYASEYRPAINTPHKKHADKCFSRIGISRVGTSPKKYDEKARGYLPMNDNDPYSSRTVPCYFSAYIAVKIEGTESETSTPRFSKTDENSMVASGTEVNDSVRNFWVPVHKLFSGDECVRDFNLELKVANGHINKKLRKIHRELSGNGSRKGYNTGKHEPEISQSPFIFKHKIADFSEFSNKSEGLVDPIPHKSLVGEARNEDNELITYITPKDKSPFRASVIIDSRSSGTRAAPEYVHAKHKVDQNGNIEDLNNWEGVVEIIRKGHYEAKHYVDYTGDGFVTVQCAELSLELPEILPAYSLVSPVDFFPLVNQEELVTWWKQSAPSDIIDKIWPENPGYPAPLSESRYPANLELNYSDFEILNYPSKRQVFDIDDHTMSVITTQLDSPAGKAMSNLKRKYDRSSSLTDGASGIYAPGWDVSIDRTEEIDANDNGVSLSPGTTFLSNYGLGSPFPEDAMLCAALSSFWPAAAPDITRSFAPGRYATATPLEDKVTGQEGQPSWNGILPPKLSNPPKWAEFTKIEYGDFVQASIDNKLDYSKISKITTEEYIARTLVMARVYHALGANSSQEKAKWVVYSFKKFEDADEKEKKEITLKLNETGISFNYDYAYRFEMFKHYRGPEPLQDDDVKVPHFRRERVLVADYTKLIADANIVLTWKDKEAAWDAQKF